VNGCGFLLWQFKHFTRFCCGIQHGWQRQGKKAVRLNESAGKGRLTPKSMQQQQQQLTPAACV